MAAAAAAAATGLAITNPLVKYRALVATRQVLPDQAQLRLALHLQKLYDRLKDYEPQLEYSSRLNQITKSLKAQDVTDPESNEVDTPASIRSLSWRSLVAAKEQRDSLALTRRLTSHESAMQLTSPKGLMLHGEVGTGKSMLIDLFADCLPTRKKRRWHFNTFMLEIFAKLEGFRRGRLSAGAEGENYSLLWLAKDMIQTSPILFLDEFQMPDRVASKILTNLMTSFFQLGGVLIATSNRMPEELAKAAGEDFPMPAPQSRLEALGWQFGLRRATRGSDNMFAGQGDFARFLELLKSRCEVWEMEGGRDYRRIDAGGMIAPERVDEGSDEWQMDGHEDLQHAEGMPGWPAAGVAEEGGEEVKLPGHYATAQTEAEKEQAVALATSKTTGMTQLDGVPWSPSAIKIYGRTVLVPRAYEGTTLWTFDELCRSTLGPADYISLASTFHTLILTDVPILTWIMKNEARRFITLLDALYECRCKLAVTAAAGPDDLFFPEQEDGGEGADDAVYSETLSEVYQDATAPFRPNVLTENPNYRELEPEPDYTHARLAGLLNAHQIEDDPPNKPRRNPFGRSFGRTDSEMERGPNDPDAVRYAAPGVGQQLDFGKTSRFTGEDERFAYKRAQSRLWEMCGSRWWARNEEGWHRPLPAEVRRWERSVKEHTPMPPVQGTGGASNDDIGMGDSVMDETRDERSFKYGDSSPYRNADKGPAPKISWTHVWGTTEWGPKAGAWGKGPEGLKERKKES